MPGRIFWRQIPGSYEGLVYRAQIEELAPQRARTLLIEGPQYRFLNFNPYLLNPNDPRLRADVERHAAAVDDGR